MANWIICYRQIVREFKETQINSQVHSINIYIICMLQVLKSVIKAHKYLDHLHASSSEISHKSSMANWIIFWITTLQKFKKATGHENDFMRFTNIATSKENKRVVWTQCQLGLGDY